MSVTINEDNIDYIYLRFTLMTRFNLKPKIDEYMEQSNACVEHDNNKIIFYKSNNDTREYEEYRVIDRYGHTCIQFQEDSNRCIINLRCFPEGAANFDRGVLIINELQLDGTYRTNTIVTNNSSLTDINLIRQSTTKSITPTYIENCLSVFEDELGITGYYFLKEQATILENILAPKNKAMTKLPLLPNED